MQERCNSIAKAMELYLSCSNPLISRQISAWQTENKEMRNADKSAIWFCYQAINGALFAIGRHMNVPYAPANQHWASL